MKVKSEKEVSQSCPTLHDPMDCSLPGSSIHGIFQARVLEWGATAFSIMHARKKKKVNWEDCVFEEQWVSIACGSQAKPVEWRVEL